MAIQNFFTSRDNNLDGNTYVGQFGRLWYNPDTNSIYASDGRTVGGIPISLAQGANISSNVFSVNTLIPLSSNLITVDTDLRVTGNVTANNFIGNIALSGNVNIGNVFSDGYYYANGEPFASSNYGNSNVVSLLADFGSNNISTTGNITATDLDITGNAVITGNLRVTGNTTFISSNDLVVGNINIVLANAAQQPSDANGAGVIVGNVTGNTYATILWNSTSNTWAISRNLQSNTATFTTAVISGNATAGNINTAGNISGNYILGNGSQLTGLPEQYGNANVANYLPTYGGNISAGNISTGNITATGTVITGSIIPSSNGIYSLGNSTSWWSNLWVTSNTIFIGGVALGTSGTDLTVGGQPLVVNDSSTNISTTGNVTAGNIVTTGALIVTGNVGGGNLVTPGRVDATGNVTGGNITTTGQVTATGNVTGGNITTTGQVTATGNVTGGNLITAGLISATSNVTGGNLITAGLISATGNATAGNLITAGLISANGNISAGNLITAGNITATGNLAAGNLISNIGIYGVGELVLGNLANASAPKFRSVNFGNNSYIQTGNGTIGSTGNIIFSPYSDATERVVINTATGNLTAGNIVGNISITGNVQGTTDNVELISGGYTWSFDPSGLMTLPTVGGDEGAEIRFGLPESNTTLQTRVTADVWQDRFRIFQGNNSRGVYIDLAQADPGASTLLNNRVSGRVNAGTFVTMDNLRATITTGGARGLSLATVSGTMSYSIGGTYGMAAAPNSSGLSVNNQTLTTTPTGSIFGWSFGFHGDMATYILQDETNSRGYRITISIGFSYNNNLVIIERVV